MTWLPTALVIGWIAMIVVGERLAPAERWHDTGRVWRNLALGGLALLVSPLLLWSVGRVAQGVVPPLPLDVLLGETLGLAAKLMALDMWTYAVHRAYHRIPFMWRLHAPHHLDRHLDASSAVRFHVLEIFWSGTLRIVPALLLGIDAATMLFFEAILLASTVFHHSNLLLPPGIERVMGWMFTTPAMHRVHHHRVQADTDSNYTSVLSIWDYLGGSRNSESWRPGLEMGVEGEGERRLALLLRYPFDRNRRNVAANGELLDDES